MSEIENEDLLRRGRARKPSRNTDEPAPAGEFARTRIDLPPYETIALMLQGGGALGAYQAGVYQGLHEAGIQSNWIAGISIEALNTAIIAGNAPQHRVTRLVEFWETVCQPAYGFPLPAFLERALFNSADEIRKAFTALQALGALVEGKRRGRRASSFRAFHRRRRSHRARRRLPATMTRRPSRQRWSAFATSIASIRARRGCRSAP